MGGGVRDGRAGGRAGVRVERVGGWEGKGLGEGSGVGEGGMSGLKGSDRDG